MMSRKAAATLLRVRSEGLPSPEVVSASCAGKRSSQSGIQIVSARSSSWIASAILEPTSGRSSSAEPLSTRERARSGLLSGAIASLTQCAAATSSASSGIAAIESPCGRPSPSQRSCDARIASCTLSVRPSSPAAQAPPAVWPPLSSTSSGSVRTATPASCSSAT